jgi:hypothetical protein
MVIRPGMSLFRWQTGCSDKIVVQVDSKRLKTPLFHYDHNQGQDYKQNSQPNRDPE